MKFPAPDAYASSAARNSPLSGGLGEVPPGDASPAAEPLDIYPALTCHRPSSGQHLCFCFQSMRTEVGSNVTVGDQQLDSQSLPTTPAISPPTQDAPQRVSQPEYCARTQQIGESSTGIGRWTYVCNCGHPHTVHGSWHKAPK